MLREDLINLLRTWPSARDTVVLMMDDNEHILNGEMSREIRGEGLRMREVVHDQTPG